MNTSAGSGTAIAISTSWTDLSIALLCVSIFALGAVLNSTLLFGILKDKLYRTSSNMYILNLALTDFIIAIGILFFPTPSFLLTSWPFTSLGCQVFELIRDCVTPVSLLTLTALSYERNRAITLIGSTRVREENYKTGLLVVLMWLASLVSLVPIAMLVKLKDMPLEKADDKWTCMLDRYEYLEPKGLVVLRCIITYQIPLVIIGYNYCVICWRLFQISNLEYYRDNAAMERSRRRALNHARLVFLLILVFVFCSFPCHFFLWIFFLAKTDVERSKEFWDNWRIIGFFLFYVYPILNPLFLYATSQQYKILFDKYLFCCRKSKATYTFSAGNMSSKRLIFGSCCKHSTRSQELDLRHSGSSNSKSTAVWYKVECYPSQVLQTHA